MISAQINKMAGPSFAWHSATPVLSITKKYYPSTPLNHCFTYCNVYVYSFASYVQYTFIMYMYSMCQEAKPFTRKFFKRPMAASKFLHINVDSCYGSIVCIIQ